MGRIFRPFIRISAFLRAEVYEALRQPRLMLTLVLGPFLVLLLVGVGYRNQARSLRTLFVAPEGSALARAVEEYAKALGDQLVYQGVVSDENAARQQLARGQVDVVVVMPANPYDSIKQNQQATLRIYHNEIDPLQADYVKYFGQIYVEEVNRRIVRQALVTARQDSGQAITEVQAARASNNALRQALQSGNAVAARQQQKELGGHLTALELAAGAGLALLGNNDLYGGTSGDSAQANLDRATKNTQDLNVIGDNPAAYPAQAEKSAQIDADLAKLETRLVELQTINPDVLLSPFRLETTGIAAVQPTLSAFFAPAVLALLLQHLAVTLAALTMVRDRQLGTLELFRISPISALETLIGKYLSYFVFSGIVAAVLSVLVIWGLRVPMLGDWRTYAVVIGALLLTSLGIGLVISLISQTDSQAVQYAMLLLLATVFFSGSFLSLNLLWEPVRLISWLLPATYAILLLQDLMIRGTILNPGLLVVLLTVGVILVFVALLLLRRRMAPQ